MRLVEARHSATLPKITNYSSPPFHSDARVVKQTPFSRASFSLLRAFPAPESVRDVLGLPAKDVMGLNKRTA
jgi:hypothetical protein